MKVALIGCGNISRVHLGVLSSMEDVTLCAVADIVPARAETAAKANGCRAYTDYIELLETEQPDCVHICTPHDLHVPMALEALKRNCHVLLEKPAAISKEGLLQLQQAQKESGKQVGICFQNRYNAGVLQALELLKNETYGKLCGARASVDWCRDETYYADDWHGKKSREGGGVLVNQAVHTMDLLHVLVGAEIASVQAHIANDHLQGVIDEEDSALVRFFYATGLQSQLTATTAFCCNAKVMIDLFCENAVLRLEGAQLYLVMPNGEVELLTGAVSDGAGKDYWGNGHPALIADFYRCLRECKPFPIDAFEGGKATKAFLAAYQSAESGKICKVE